MAKAVYDTYFDIEHMVVKAEQDHVTFVVAVSEDKERGAGKTYSTAKLMYKRYVERGERFMMFVRNIKDLGNVANGVFDEFMIKEHPNQSVSEVIQSKGAFSNIYLNTIEGDETKKEHIGFVAPLKSASAIKLHSSKFSAAEVKLFWMDEFQPLDNHYLPNETDLMKIIYDSANRRLEDLVIILTANTITLGNPYFHMLGLNSKIQTNTRAINTDTCIYENVVVEGLAEKHITSAANKAFGKNDEKYLNNVWINDDGSLVCKPTEWGRAIYICTLYYNGKPFGVYQYPQVGYTYLSRTYDKGCQYVYNLTLDGDLNIPLLKTTPYLDSLKKAFFRGLVRVQDVGLQAMLMEIFG